MHGTLTVHARYIHGYTHLKFGYSTLAVHLGTPAVHSGTLAVHLGTETEHRRYIGDTLGLHSRKWLHWRYIVCTAHEILYSE